MRNCKDELMCDRRAAFPAWRLRLSLIGLLLVTVAGCGSTPDPNQFPVFPAAGKVSFKGAPPVGAVVMLHPKSGVAKGFNAELVCPRAQVQSDGTFALTSYIVNDGAPPGDYVATVEWHKIVKTARGEPDLGPDLLPFQYSRPQSSPLKVTIIAGKNDLPPIVLK